MSNTTRSPVADALLGPTEAIEASAGLDPAAARLRSLALAVPPATRSFLGGDWLGHALHPAMTDLPIGCWTSSMMLDFLGGRSARAASQRLTGWGVLLAVPTLATGLTAYSGVEDDASKRTGVVHAAGNGIATVAYAISWRRRRAGHHGRGVMWGLVGATAATAAGYLGGHLAFSEPADSAESTDSAGSTDADHTDAEPTGSGNLLQGAR
jgi:hypothetical protein